MAKSPDFERTGVENLGKNSIRTAHPRGRGRVLRNVAFFVGSLALAACVAPSPVEAPQELSDEGFIRPKPMVVTLESRQPIEYLNGDGAWVVSEGNKMTVSKDGLKVTVSCVPGHEYVGRMLPLHIDFTVEPGRVMVGGKHFWTAITGPDGLRRIISYGGLYDHPGFTLHQTHHSIRDFTGASVANFLPGKEYTVSVFQTEGYTEGMPNFGFPIKQLRVLTPSPCPID